MMPVIFSRGLIVLFYDTWLFKIDQHQPGFSVETTLSSRYIFSYQSQGPLACR